MKITYEEYKNLHQLSHTDLAYIEHDEALNEFIAYKPSKDSVAEAVRNRKKFPVDRKLLLEVLKKQYAQLNLPIPIEDAVLLDENTFTITTAHQPVLFTGPLFHIYKIASVIHLADDLNKSGAGEKFIPVFIMSGEDHDWEEVNHFHLFGRRYEWERKASGPCGRLSTDGLENLINTVVELFKNTPFISDIRTLLMESMSQSASYGDFHRKLIATLFGKFGLIVISLDDPELKKAFIPLIEKEIKEGFSYKHVTATQSLLEKKGFKVQAYCRQVNLFYMNDDVRERLDPVDGGLKRAVTGKKLTIEEVLAELHSNPERFSPNVILRPLYQEFILPNIAYVGGGGELAYWMERKAQFEAAGVHYPMLIRRNSVLLIDKATSAQIEKLELSPNDMFRNPDAIVKKYLQNHSKTELTYEQEMQMIHTAYRDLAGKAEKIDPTLSKAILAEESKQVKVFDQLGSRLLRTEKQQQDTQIKRIQRIKEKLFPGGGLQERNENFLSFYANTGPALIDSIVETCDPWIEKFTLVELAE